MTLAKWLLILARGAGTYKYITHPTAPIESGVLEDLPGYVGPQVMGFQEIGGQIQSGIAHRPVTEGSRYTGKVH
jgi:hypothetical protein